MVKTLRSAAVLAFLSLPVILFLGRPVETPCQSPALPKPCDPLPPSSPTWLGPVFWAVIGLAALLLLLGAVANHRPQEDRP
jgi:hypothetical protein